MPALPTCPNGMRGKRALTSLAEHGLGMEIEETGSIFLADGCFPNGAESLACRNSSGLGRHRSIAALRFLALLDFARNRAMSTNLFRFLDRVQQLLVRVLFPLGISDGENPISHVTFR